MRQMHAFGGRKIANRNSLISPCVCDMRAIPTLNTRSRSPPSLSRVCLCVAHMLGDDGDDLMDADANQSAEGLNESQIQTLVRFI